ncbi:MAG: Gfo/Idh/MocA family oxidoreductase [Kiritimatiellae bacterium]|nr:Gfo/Idh/MocA family oxidoreductase [Kiritimatiellia bacterium]
MSDVKVGIIGLGGMGSFHFGNLRGGKVRGANVTAVFDPNPARLAWAREQGIAADKCFDDRDVFLAKGGMDAVINATPHFFQPANAIAALQHGLHTLIEKPAGVYARQVHEMIAAAEQSKRIFAIMLNCRTLPVYRKMRELVQGGELGAIQRVNWVVTDWFRTQAYYDGGGWRATWAGEGGGVLLNQCPHQLDLLQWICGRPTRVHAFMTFGKYHNIEVEDDVTAYLEFPGGATGTFITTTGEAPGVNRFEIAGEFGRLLAEDGKLTFQRNRVSSAKRIRESKELSDKPECWKIDLTPSGTPESGHVQIIQNWVDAIVSGQELISPGTDGIHSLEMSNAMLLSGWTSQAVALPVDPERFYAELQAKIRESKSRKPKTAGTGTHKVAGFTG